MQQDSDRTTARSKLLIGLVVGLIGLASGALWLRAAMRLDEPHAATSEAARSSDGIGAAMGTALGTPGETTPESGTQTAGAPRRTALVPGHPDAIRAAAGSLRQLDVVALDARTQEPIAELALVVYREQRGRAVCASGVTDTRGRVSFESPELDCSVLLVESRRTPPYAPSLAAAWVPPGTRVALELQVTRGGSVVGHVVDAYGDPLPGASIFASRRTLGEDPTDTRGREFPFDPSAALAVTDAQGRFEVDALASRPRGVWIVDGQPRPESWDEVALQATHQGLTAVRYAHVEPGERVSSNHMGEPLVLQLPASRKLAGRVVDERVSGIAGALLAVPAEAALARDSRQLAWRWVRADTESMVRTDQDGSFELEAGSARTLAVRHPDGRAELFKLDRDRGDDVPLELVLLPQTQLVLRFDLTPNDAFAQERVLVSLRCRGEPSNRELEFSEAELPPRLEVRLPVRPEDVELLTVGGAAVEPTAYEFESPPAWNEELEFELARKPVLCAQLEIVESLRSDEPPRVRNESEPAPIRLRACLAAQNLGVCCGYGSSRELEPRDGACVVLRTRREGPFWIHVEGLAEPTQTRGFGPFEPGETASIRLDADWLVPRTAGAQGAPPILRPGEVLRRPQITGLVVDARTQEPIPGTALTEILETEQRTYESHAGQVDANGRLNTLFLEPGLHVLKLRVDDYDVPPPLDEGLTVELDWGEVHDLGRIELLPNTAWRARFVDADGQSLEDHAILPVGQPGRWWEQIDDGQPVTVGWDLPDSFALEVGDGHWGHHGFGAWNVQRLALDRWDPEQVPTIRLPRWRTVEVRFTGLPEEHAHTRIELDVRLPPGDSRTALGPSCDSGDPEILARDKLFLRKPETGLRTVRFKTSPGRYELDVRCALYEFTPRAIEVPTAGDVPVFELRARAR